MCVCVGGGGGGGASPHSSSECAYARLPTGAIYNLNPVMYLNADCLQWFMGLVEGHSDDQGGVGEGSRHGDWGEGPGSREHHTSTAVKNTI